MRCLFTLVIMLPSVTYAGPKPAIVRVTREVYREHPRPKTAAWVSVRYVGPGLVREERFSTMARSDTPEKPQRRWSKDNGRT